MFCNKPKICIWSGVDIAIIIVIRITNKRAFYKFMETVIKGYGTVIIVIYRVIARVS